MTKRIALLLLLCSLVFAGTPARANPQDWYPVMPEAASLLPGLCEKVVDGDTAWFQVEEDGVLLSHKVRFLLMDTPETVHPLKEVEEGGKRASDFVTSFLTGKQVYLEYDSQRTDRYGRQLCHIWLEEGLLFNLFLVEMGMAEVMVYRPNIKYLEYFTSAQQRAKAAGLGIWAMHTE